MSAGDEPAEHHLYSDSSAVYDWIIQQLQVPPDRIILYGKSLGTAATIDLGTRVRAIGMILVCPLASGARVVFPTMKNFITDGVFCPSISKIGKVKAPVFIMHGTKDEVIAVCNGQDLYEECKANHPLPPVLVDGAAAHDMDTYGHTLTHARTLSLVHSLTPPTPPTHPPSPPLSTLPCATQQHVLFHQVWVDGAGHNDIESRHHAVFLKGIRMFLDHCSEMRQLQGR